MAPKIYSCLRNEKMSNLLVNGSILLEDLIASCDGKANPIRNYSAKELITATNNFDRNHRITERDGNYHLFKASLDNRFIIIRLMRPEYYLNTEAIRDIIISMQMSTHKNVLKLLGCCLELDTPALVYEYAGKGFLNQQGGLRFADDESHLPWKTRLHIAKQIANAVTYLHTAFPRPIIHKNLKHSCIFLDDDFVPKLWDFSLSVTIPPGQFHVEDDLNWMMSTSGYIAPECSSVSEKTDVYSFGLILLVFLTGREVLEAKQISGDSQIETIVDPKILEELGGDDHEQAQHQQLRDFLKLALLCIKYESEARPEMIDVAKELVRIDKSIVPS